MLVKCLNGVSVLAILAATAVTTCSMTSNEEASLKSTYLDLDNPAVKTSCESYIEEPIPCLYYDDAVDSIIENISVEEAVIYNPPIEDVHAIARTLYGECRGIPSDMEKAAVVWCILNRVDAKGYGCGNSVEYVLEFPYQFLGYNENNPLLDDLCELAEDVLIRWYREKNGETDVGRILPPEYLWFHGDGKHNYFRDAYKGGNRWDWSLDNPYEN